jgi:hypothetical protein
MDGHIEPLSGILRIGGEYGQPYTWVATLRYISPTEVEVMGATVAPTPSERRAIRDVLKSAGINKAFYYRMSEVGEVERINLTK